MRGNGGQVILACLHKRRSSAPLWADNETTVDLLGVRHLVTAVRETVLDPRLLPVTVGVFGGWGSGKSSLLAMVREELEDEEDVLCISFNGWLFEGYEDAKSALMATILDEVRQRRKLGPKAQALLARLMARVNWFRLAALAGKGAVTLAAGDPGVAATLLPFGTFAKDVSMEVAKDLDPDELEKVFKDAPDEPTQTVRGFRKDFVELLESTNIKTLVVFIDELDRCLPDTVVETLEAIRLFLFADSTAFVIGADERLVEHAVHKRLAHEGQHPGSSRDYLEKMVQVPFRIPSLGPSEIETFMNLLFAELHLGEEEFTSLVGRPPGLTLGEYGEVRFSYSEAQALLVSVPSSLSEGFVLAQQLAPVLTTVLDGNPRQTKRFLNALFLRLRLAQLREIELRESVLGKLMLLEYFKSESFRELGGLYRDEVLRAPSLEMLEKRASLLPEVAALPNEGDKKKVRSGTKPRTSAVAKEDSAAMVLAAPLEKWLNDDWLRNWLTLEPSLASVDLRPYFYIAREQVGTMTSRLVEISPRAHASLVQLRSDSESVRIAGAKAAGELSPANVAGVFQTLTAEAQAADELEAGQPPLASLFALVESRDDLSSELLGFLESQPAARLPIAVVPALWSSIRQSAPERGSELLERWANTEENSKLAQAAKAQLAQNAK